MVEFQCLSGSRAGVTTAARHFPFTIGRSPDSQLPIEDPGVFERHVAIEFVPGEGFIAAVQPPALALLNGAPLERARLRNGDVLELGGVQVRFRLGAVAQRGLGLREAVTWAALAVLCLAQLAIIYWLLP